MPAMMGREVSVALPKPEEIAAPTADDRGAAAPAPDDFPGLVALFESHGDARLYSELYANVHLVHYRPGRLEIRPRETAPSDLAHQVMARLKDWTGERWVVSISGAPGEPTLRQQERSEKERALAEAAALPLVRAILAAFPGAKVKDIHPMPESGLVAGSSRVGGTENGSPDALFEAGLEGNLDLDPDWAEADETGDE